MENVEIIYAAITVVIVLFLIIGRSKSEYLHGFKMAGAWLMILVGVVAAVIYWDDFRNTKFYTSLFVGEAITKPDGSMEFSRADDGHFHINALVNGVEIKFMVDTGASDIVLSQSDAAKLGINLSSLKFDRLYSTANGYTRGATVTLQNIQIGNYQTGQIPASINEGALRNSLLGLRFLNKMQSYRIEGSRLILVP